MYLIFKTIHISTVIISISLFTLRMYWSYKKTSRLQLTWVKVLPHINDSVLLASAIFLCYQLQQFPFENHWLTSKVIALLVYIIAGSFALKYAKTPMFKLTTLIIAIFSIIFIISVALSHHPFGIFRFIV